IEVAGRVCGHTLRIIKPGRRAGTIVAAGLTGRAGERAYIGRRCNLTDGVVRGAACGRAFRNVDIACAVHGQAERRVERSGRAWAVCTSSNTGSREVRYVSINDPLLGRHGVRTVGNGYRKSSA